MHKLILLLASLFFLSSPVLSAQSDVSDAVETSSQTEQTPTSSPTTQVNKRPKVPKLKPQEYYINEDLERYFQPDELVKLLAGEDDFYALFRDDLTGRPRGVAILIPDWGLHAANNRGIESLRTHLPDLGWVTLSMNVPSIEEPVHIHKSTSQNNTDNQQPDTPSTPPEQNTTSSSPNNSQRAAYVPAKPLRTIDENQFQSFELAVKLRLQALITEAQNHQGYFIIIAQGASAAAVASIYTGEDLDFPEALILLSANLPDRMLANKMNQDISINPIPTLDIYPSSSPRILIYNAQLRRKLAKKNFKVGYRQQKLFGDISQFNQNRKLLKSVYGWLSSLGL